MKSFRIAHISDPHFGTILPGIKEGLVASLKEIAPSLILITGDITQRARASQFRAARAFTKELRPIPIIAVPGNHDIPLMNLPARLFYPYRGFKKLFKDQLEKDHIYNDIAVIGLNSTSKWRHVQGDFNIERIKRRFEKFYEGINVKIAAFHHPMDCAKHVDDKNLLRGRCETMKVLDEAKVDLVVGGHIHDPYVSLSDQRYPEISRKMILSVAGTCLSWRTRAGAPNSFNLIEIQTGAGPQISLSRYDINDQKRYRPILTRRFVRAEPSGWMEQGV